LIIAGSYVPKTTAQLKVLTDQRGGTGQLAIIEMNVEGLIASVESASQTIQQTVQEAESHIQSGKDTLIMTSRKLITGSDELSSLAIGTNIAEALVTVLRKVQVRPRYIIAKVTLSNISPQGRDLSMSDADDNDRRVGSPLPTLLPKAST
jgi:uncharacterized protein YgbK (DUF1537 family)